MKHLAIILLTLLVFTGCSTIPEVNPRWISSNCQSPGYQVSDTSEYSNCSRSYGGVYTCKFSNGKYVGKYNKKGEMHGEGDYKFIDGTVYAGTWKNGAKWCGIQRDGNNFITYINGAGKKGQAGVDWGAVAAGIVVAGAVYAVADVASNSGSSSSRNSSTVKCSYNLNNKTIKINNPNYSWGSCPSSHSYKEPLMCSETYSYASPRCEVGKACGNTCISSYDTCHVGKGSACNLNYASYP